MTRKMADNIYLLWRPDKADVQLVIVARSAWVARKAAQQFTGDPHWVIAEATSVKRLGTALLNQPAGVIVSTEEPHLGVGRD